MRVLGIDPGLGVTGYAVVELTGAQPRLVEAGAIRPPARKPLPERLLAAHADVTAILRELSPEVMGLESLFSEYKFPRSALQMAHVRGVVCLAAAAAGVPVVDIAPSEVKNAVVGEGRASKAQMQRTVQSLFALKNTPAPADVADAIAIATAVAYRAMRGVR